MASNAMYLVCDMLNDLVHEDGPSKKTYGPELARRNTVANTAEAIRKAREAGVKIGYVRIGFSADYRECPPNSRIFQGAKKAGMFKLGDWGTEVHPALAPQPGREPGQCLARGRSARTRQGAGRRPGRHRR